MVLKKEWGEGRRAGMLPSKELSANAWRRFCLSNPRGLLLASSGWKPEMLLSTL